MIGGFAAIGAALALLLAGCSDDAEPRSQPPASSSATDFDDLVKIDDGRSLHLRCTGTGSPTLVLEGGDDDASSSYNFAVASLEAATRTCVYDRANLGTSDPDPRCRGLSELVSDLEQVLSAGSVPGPYVLVGTSGGGHIVAGYAVAHRQQVAGMVFVEVPPPSPDPPADLVAETACGAPGNIESRAFLQVERDAWAARREIGDIPITVISNQYSPDEVAGAPAFERALVRDNVKLQSGWLVLSPRAEQLVVHTGHAVEEVDPQLVIDAILAVVEAAR